MSIHTVSSSSSSICYLHQPIVHMPVLQPILPRRTTITTFDYHNNNCDTPNQRFYALSQHLRSPVDDKDEWTTTTTTTCFWWLGKRAEHIVVVIVVNGLNIALSIDIFCTAWQLPIDRSITGSSSSSSHRAMVCGRCRRCRRCGCHTEIDTMGERVPE